MNELPNGRSTVQLVELMTGDDIASLRKYVKSQSGKLRNTHNLTMAWLDKNPEVVKRLVKHGIIKAYAAYVFELYVLKDIK